MRSLLLSIALGFAMLSPTAVLAEDTPPPAVLEESEEASCDLYTQTVQKVTGAKSFEEVREAMAVAGFGPGPAEELSQMYEGNLEAARKDVLMVLEAFEDAICSQ